VRLYERWIETPHGGGPVRDTVASVDSQIASRITATRLVTLGGVYALAAKKKTGAIYLSIDNPALASVIECPKDDNIKARQFAVQITNAGKAAAVIEEQLAALIEQAKADLEACQEATRPIEFAQEELAAIEAEPTMLEAIRAEEPRSLWLSRSWPRSPTETPRRRRSLGHRRADGHDAGAFLAPLYDSVGPSGHVNQGPDGLVSPAAWRPQGPAGPATWIPVRGGPVRCRPPCSPTRPGAGGP
jgi:hypothetical protein